MVREAWQGFEWELRATLQQIKIQSQPGHVCRDRLRGLVIRWALLARNIHRRSRELEAFPSEVLGARTPEDRPAEDPAVVGGGSATASASASARPSMPQPAPRRRKRRRLDDTSDSD